ncbi:MAG: hypothetical protein ACM30E_10050 [Nitrososphaerales archaeon]
MLTHACHCHCRIITDAHSGDKRLVIEGSPALVIPRAMWNAAFAAPASVDEECADWDTRWLGWPLEIGDHIARFDAHVLMIEEALPIERENRGRQ